MSEEDERIGRAYFEVRPELARKKGRILKARLAISGRIKKKKRSIVKGIRTRRAARKELKESAKEAYRKGYRKEYLKQARRRGKMKARGSGLSYQERLKRFNQAFG